MAQVEVFSRLVSSICQDLRHLDLRVQRMTDGKDSQGRLLLTAKVQSRATKGRTKYYRGHRQTKPTNSSTGRPMLIWDWNDKQCMPHSRFYHT